MVSDDDTYLGPWLVAAGRSIANGGQIFWGSGFDNVLIGADGSVYGDKKTALNIWYRDPLNGRNYLFNVSLNETGTIDFSVGGIIANKIVANKFAKSFFNGQRF